MKKTKIEWCDATWNPVTGCFHNCPYCYARSIAIRFGRAGVLVESESGLCKALYGTGQIHELESKIVNVNGKTAPYPFEFDPTFHKYKLEELDRWKKPYTIFVGSMTDLFGKWVPLEWQIDVFSACRRNPQHRYMFLTKDVHEFMKIDSFLPQEDNFWYGASITGPDDYFIIDPRYNTFVSIEPLLARLGKCEITDSAHFDGFSKVKWVIIGAETGRRKEKIIPEKEWVDEIVERCDRYGTPVFMKNSLLPIMGEENMRRDFPWEVAE